VLENILKPKALEHQSNEAPEKPVREFSNLTFEGFGVC
jgi:hypothetical protein